jgi:tetratricopeptide (TPR) repeat protein
MHAGTNYIILFDMKNLKKLSSIKLSRRDFIKRIGLANLALFTPTFWTSKPVYGFDFKEITFEEVYPVPFYEKDWFIPAVIAATIVATAAILFFTAGAGAPAAAPGVSTIASWIGGGGAGSYMAGLSTVGAWFGGNAILGAAILNSISLTFLGGIGALGKSGLTMGAIVATLSDLALTGIQLKVAFDNAKNNSSNNGIIFQIDIPYELGSKPVKEHILKPLEEISNKISDIQKDLMSLHQDICEVKSEKNFEKLKEIEREVKEKNKKLELLTNKKNKLLEIANRFLSRNINSLSIEDLLVLGVIANNTANINLFHKCLIRLNRYASVYSEKFSFLEFLNGIFFLEEMDFKKAEKHLYNSLKQEPYVVETGIALITALSQNYSNNRKRILKIVEIIEEEYDDDNYKGKNLQILYYHAGTVAMVNEDYQLALKYFQKAYDSLPFVVKYIPFPHIGPFKTLDEVKNFFQMPIAVTYKLAGRKDLGREILEKILERCNNIPCRKECREKYLNWYEHADKRIEV